MYTLIIGEEEKEEERTKSIQREEMALRDGRLIREEEMILIVAGINRDKK